MNRDWSPTDIEDAPDVSARLARLFEDEPPFERSLAEATSAAVHGGRRRRVRAQAVRVVMAGVVVAGVGAAAVVSGQLGSSPTASVATGPTPSPAPTATRPAPTVATTPGSAAPSPVASDSPPPATTTSGTTQPPSSSAGPTTSAAVATTDGDRVKSLALAVSNLIGVPTVVEQSGPRDAADASPYLTRLRVDTPGGPLEVAVDLDPSEGTSVGLMAESCRLDNGGADSGRRCTPISVTGQEGVWSRTYPAQPGRVAFMLAATTAAGETVHVVVDNYVEQPDGSKTTGPSWQDSGLDAATVQSLVQQSGLLG